MLTDHANVIHAWKGNPLCCSSQNLEIKILMKPQTIQSTCGCTSQGWNRYNYHKKYKKNQEIPDKKEKGLKGTVEKYRNKKERVSRYTQQ